MERHIPSPNKIIVLIFILFACLTNCAHAQTVMHGTSSFLYEYAVSLYEEGDIRGAIHQLKISLLANPDNRQARDFLDKILIDQGLKRTAPALVIREQETSRLNKQLGYIQEEIRYYQGQLNALKGSATLKEKDLASRSQRIQSEINNYYIQLSKEEQNVVKLEPDYENKLYRLQEELATKEYELEKLKANKNSLLSTKDKNLAKLKSDYENQLMQMQQEIQDKEYAIERLKSGKDSFLEEALTYENLRRQKLREIMSEIEELVPELRRLSQDAGVKEESRSFYADYSDRIESMMREIEEVVPEVREMAPTLGRRDDYQGDERLQNIIEDIQEVLPQSE